MKLEFNKEKLTAAMGTVLRAIPSRTTNPILECILFETEGDKVKLTANDSEFGIETKTEANIIEKGKIALDAKLTYEIIRKLEGTDAPIVIESDDTFRTTISCMGAVFNIQGRDGEEFSYLPDIEKNRYICLSQFSLKEAIRQTIFAAAMNDSNKMMGGEYIEVRGSRAQFVALDGHRIAIRNIELRDDYGNEKVIIPGRTMNEISKIMTDDNEKEVLIYFSQNHVLFEFDDTVVISRRIEGEYFRIEHMLSKDYEIKVKINRQKFLSSIDRATILIRESDHKPIILDIEENTISMKVKSAFGTMDAAISCEKEGKNIMIAFNPKFVMDSLRAIDDEEVVLYMTNAKAPCYIRDEKESYTYLILPVNFIV